jgi:serine phosphatase RsbU (regulator of sigma subunit)
MATIPYIAGRSRPYPGETENGDAWAAEYRDPLMRIVMVDGLGHGESAASVARMAIEALSPTLFEPQAILQACHHAIAGTRGAAVSATVIDLQARIVRYAGVGNIEALLWTPSGTKHLLSARGIVGKTLPKLRTEEYRLDTAWRLVLHTDGIKTGLRYAEEPWQPLNADVLAARLLDHFARDHDDATVVVAEESQHPVP